MIEVIKKTTIEFLNPDISKEELVRIQKLNKKNRAYIDSRVKEIFTPALLLKMADAYKDCICRMYDESDEEFKKRYLAKINNKNKKL